MNILLGVSGSVAAIKCWELFRSLKEIGDVRIVLTEKGGFFAERGIPVEGKLGYIIRDSDEWNWDKIGDPIKHIDLKDWADILVIAPLSANTLAKICHGFCDNLLTSIYRAWPISKPIILAPAMNTDMWEHPLTEEQLQKMSTRHHNLQIVDPVEKKLACGVNGMGAMASIESIVEATKLFQFERPNPLKVLEHLQELGDDAPPVEFSMTSSWSSGKDSWSLTCQKCGARVDDLHYHQNNPDICLIYAVLGA